MERPGPKNHLSLSLFIMVGFPDEENERLLRGVEPRTTQLAWVIMTSVNA